MFDVRVQYDFDFTSSEYSALFERSDATAFQHPLWLHHLYAVLVPSSGATPFVIVARHGNGSLAMVMPLLCRSRGPIAALEFADLGVSDYNSPICDRATFSLVLADAEARRQLRRAVARCDLLRIDKIRADGLPLGLLFDTPAVEMPESAHSLSLQSPYEEWRARVMAPSLVKDIERKWRQLARFGPVDFAPVTEASAIEAAFEEMRAFRERRFRDRPGKDFLQSADGFRFYRDVAAGGAASGFTRLYRLSVGDQTVAVDFGLSHRGAFLGLLRGFDEQAHKNRSLGMLMTDALLAEAVARGDVCFDLTIGDEGYKKLFGATPTPMLAIKTRGTLFGGLAMIAAERLPRVHGVAKRLLGA